ncbi:hypothetical protein BDQ17DRAFT_1420806 [Cyathus striatus]|nr:hypothetical protein BDQ17DRAFT_1420806 [Cyathus striatus]
MALVRGHRSGTHWGGGFRANAQDSRKLRPQPSLSPDAKRLFHRILTMGDMKSHSLLHHRPSTLAMALKDLGRVKDNVADELEKMLEGWNLGEG